MYGHAEGILKGNKSNQERSSVLFGERMDLASLPAGTKAWPCVSAELLMGADTIFSQPW